ncbi:unnamed protein product, partial [Lepidochelys olivacea]
MAAGSDAPVAPPPAVRHSAPPSRCGSRPRRGCSPAGPRNRAGPPQPPRPPSAAPAGDPYGERVELALREAAPEPSPEAGPGCEELTLDHLLEIVAQLEYHTRPEDGVRICPHFLLGCCFSGARCPPHRTLLPYLWQLWWSTSLPPGWLSVGPEAHGALERLYGDPERTHVRASYQGTSPSTSTWWPCSFTRVRRLKTPPAPGTPFRTTRTYCWKALGGWEPDSEPFAQSIEAALRSGQEEALCSTADHGYRLDLRAGSQRNLATGTLRARPAFRAPALLLPELRTLSGSLHPGPPPAPGPPAGPALPRDLGTAGPRAGLAAGARGGGGVRLPAHLRAPPQEPARGPVPPGAGTAGAEPLPVGQVPADRQTSLEQRLRNERHLFHGTSAGAVPAFGKHYLDRRLPGEHAALYGQGSYFARRASYSHPYAPPAEAGLRHGSLCKVLVGRSGLGQPAPAPGRRRPGQRPVRLVRGQPERPPDRRGLRRRPVLPLLPAPVPPTGGGGEGGL